MDEIEHRTVRARSPQTNSFVERPNRPLPATCFHISGPIPYLEPDEMQPDLARFLLPYHRQRTQPPHLLTRRPQAPAPREALPIAELPARTRIQQEAATPAA